jgi:flagellar hook-associated protein 3 FlgL
MSGSVTAAGGETGYGLLGIIVADSQNTKKRLDTLTEQAADGLVADTYGGLGAAASVALSLSPQIAGSTAIQSAISASTSQMQLAQTALGEISSIASAFYADTDELNGLNPSDIDLIASQAQQALQAVAGLLDSQDGGNYVFAGQDSSNPPIPNPEAIWSSGFATQIQTAVAGLAGSGSAAVIASTLASASSNAAGTSPFSTALSQPAAAVNALQTSVQVGPGQSVTTGILASTNAGVTSLGTSTTGSYTRDILRALATLGSLSSSQATTTGFSSVVADVRGSLGNAITALNEDAGVMGNTQAQLTATQTELSQTSIALNAQVSNVETVDMASTLSALTSAQTQLQASYQLIAGLQSLSLTNYLTTSTG